MIYVLRRDPTFVKELDFVMEQDGKLIGQNMFMKTIIEADDGRTIPVLTMGPIGIRYHDLPEDADSSFFLCKELIPGYLDDVTGVYQTPQGYYVKDEDVDAFDKEFPLKEKLKLPGQIFG